MEGIDPSQMGRDAPIVPSPSARRDRRAKVAFGCSYSGSISSLVSIHACSMLSTSGLVEDDKRFDPGDPQHRPSCKGKRVRKMTRPRNQRQLENSLGKARGSVPMCFAGPLRGQLLLTLIQP